jgi:hypothetical protein
VPTRAGQVKYGLSFLKRAERNGRYPNHVKTIGVPKPVTSIAILNGSKHSAYY